MPEAGHIPDPELHRLLLRILNEQHAQARRLDAIGRWLGLLGSRTEAHRLVEHEREHRARAGERGLAILQRHLAKRP